MPRIIGIDPGSLITGFGVIESDGMRSNYVTSGCIKLRGKALPDRLGQILADLGAVLDKYRPQQFAVEQVFLAHNASSALTLGHARGAAICAAVSRGLEV